MYHNIQSLSIMHRLLPAQLTPLPVYPALQAQVNVPAVLVHVAPVA